MSLTNVLSWKKFYRDIPFDDSGALSVFLKLAFATAYADGKTKYYKYINEVKKSQWVGGIVGLKSICGIKNSEKLFQTLNLLKSLRYIDFVVETNKKITVTVQSICYPNVPKKQLADHACCATSGYGFVCLPINIADNLISYGYTFSDNDALIDLWSHTIFGDNLNVFSFLSPCIEFNNKAVMTLEDFGRRWNWEKTKVSRFFKKYSQCFILYKLPCSYGSIVFNRLYPVDKKIELPSSDQLYEICRHLKELASEKEKKWTNRKQRTENEKINILVKRYSAAILENITINDNSQTYENEERFEQKTVNSLTIKQIRYTIKNKLHSLTDKTMRCVCSGLHERFNYNLLLYRANVGSVLHIKNYKLKKLSDGFRLLGYENFSPGLYDDLSRLTGPLPQTVYCGTQYYILNCLM